MGVSPGLEVIDCGVFDFSNSGQDFIGWRYFHILFIIILLWPPLSVKDSSIFNPNGAFIKVRLNVELSFLPKFYEVKGRKVATILILAKVRSKFYLWITQRKKTEIKNCG